MNDDLKELREAARELQENEHPDVRELGRNLEARLAELEGLRRGVSVKFDCYGNSYDAGLHITEKDCRYCKWARACEINTKGL